MVAERVQASVPQQGASPWCDPQDALTTDLGPQDPPDYDSAAYAPLRQAGCTPSVLAQYGVRLVGRRNERAAHPSEVLRLHWRYPVWDDHGDVLTYRLAAVDGQYPRSAWDGPAHPACERLYIYQPLGIIAGQPLLLLGDVLSVWVWASLDIIDVPAAAFLCAPFAGVPHGAMEQVRQGQPSSVLVVDNERPALPGGALAVVRALRAAGVPAGYVRLPWSLAPDILGGMTMAAWLCLGGRRGHAAAVLRDLEALGAGRLA